MTQLYRKKNKGALAKGFAFGKYPLSDGRKGGKRKSRKTKRGY